MAGYNVNVASSYTHYLLLSLLIYFSICLFYPTLLYSNTALIPFYQSYTAGYTETYIYVCVCVCVCVCVLIALKINTSLIILYVALMAQNNYIICKVFIHSSIHLCMYMYMYNTCTCIVHIYVSMCTCTPCVFLFFLSIHNIPVYVYVCTCACTIHVYVCLCTCIVHVYVSMCTCIPYTFFCRFFYSFINTLVYGVHIRRHIHWLLLYLNKLRLHPYSVELMIHVWYELLLYIT